MILQATKIAAIILQATSDSGSKRSFELQPNEGVFVGSSGNCGFQLIGNGLSDIHCRIWHDNDQIWLQDWMSSTGTCVNGNPVTTVIEVELTDVIQVGPYRIVVEGPASRSPEVSRSTDASPSPEVIPPPEELSTSSVAETSSESIQRRSDSDCVEAKHAKEPRVTGADEVTPSAEDMEFAFFDLQEEETYDRETVALLQAEIETLQTALAQRDADHLFDRSPQSHASAECPATEASDEVLHRMHELVDEANRSDERVALLEQMLHAADDANRSEQEERHHLEAWVGDIEKRIGQREEEHVAEVQSLRQRLSQSDQQQDRLHRQLHQANTSGKAPDHYEETLENLQRDNRQMREDLAESQKQCLSLQQRLESRSNEQGRALREERANIAKEQAKLSRLRYEISSKLADVEELPKSDNQADRDTSVRIQALREHLREIHLQEKEEEQEASLSTRLAKLWKRVEY